MIKKYYGWISQNGNESPIVERSNSDLENNVTWSHDGDGMYLMFSENAFSENTYIQITSGFVGIDDPKGAILQAEKVDDSTILVRAYGQDGTWVSSNHSRFFIEITIIQ